MKTSLPIAGTKFGGRVVDISACAMPSEKMAANNRRRHGFIQNK